MHLGYSNSFSEILEWETSWFSVCSLPFLCSVQISFIEWKSRRVFCFLNDDYSLLKKTVQYKMAILTKKPLEDDGVDQKQERKETSKGWESLKSKTKLIGGRNDQRRFKNTLLGWVYTPLRWNETFKSPDSCSTSTIMSAKYHGGEEDRIAHWITQEESPPTRSRCGNRNSISSNSEELVW